MADFTVSPSITFSDRMLTLPAILAAPLSRMVDWQSAWVPAPTGAQASDAHPLRPPPPATSV